MKSLLNKFSNEYINFYNLNSRGLETKNNYFKGGVVEKRLRTTGLNIRRLEKRFLLFATSLSDYYHHINQPTTHRDFAVFISLYNLQSTFLKLVFAQRRFTMRGRRTLTHTQL